MHARDMACYTTPANNINKKSACTITGTDAGTGTQAHTIIVHTPIKQHIMSGHSASATNIAYPLIPNPREYVLERKYVSISASDRNMEKYPNSAQFEIELPQALINISSCRLHNWSLPSNQNVFSAINANIMLVFQLTPTALYLPSGAAEGSIEAGIYAALVARGDTPFHTFIEPGFYNPTQMATELTNKLNMAVSIYLQQFFLDSPEYNHLAITHPNVDMAMLYTRFIVVYNEVGQQLWFGNTADGFGIMNSSPEYYVSAQSCARKNVLPSASNWGLPFNLGFTRTDAWSAVVQNPAIYPRFYYSNDMVAAGDGGIWLQPIDVDAMAHVVVPDYKINFMGPAYIYMEMNDFNCIDETSPYNLSEVTHTTNATNGKTNAAFAKLGVLDTPISQYYDDGSMPYKYFSPPLDRLSRIRVKFRYHTGELVEFGTFDYSFMIEFTCLRPLSGPAYSIRSADGLGQIQSLPGK